MFYLEKLFGETPEQLRAWLENLLYELHPAVSRHVAELLEREGERLSDWPGIVDVGKEIHFEGKTYCFIRWIASRTVSCLIHMVGNGDIPRDVITVLWQIDDRAGARLAAKLSGSGHLDESYELPPSHTVAKLYRDGVITEIDPRRIDGLGETG